MREKLKNNLLLLLNTYVDTKDLKIIDQELNVMLSDYEIAPRKTDLVAYEYKVPDTIEIYIVSKKIAGLSDKTLYLYNMVLSDFFQTIQKQQEKITANDIRVYLYKYQKEYGISNRTLDCRRTVIRSYFGWLASEEYINKNPAINIAPIKYERKHKKPMSQLELEKIRLACKTKREKAIVEILYSTGCRVTELERLNISDINFETKELMLLGKGDKHRTSYLNAKAEVALKDYLSNRMDSNPALFVYDRKPYGRFKKSGIENMIRKIMERVPDVMTHVTPHVFRHTTATTAIDRGMNIVDVSKLLGHSKIETTMEYVSVDLSSIKNNHQNCII